MTRLYKLNILIVCLLAGFYISGQQIDHSESTDTNKSTVKNFKTMENKMKVEIWSDIMCPFCYIGKRKFEQALSNFEHKDKIEIVWKSFQLNPNISYQKDKDLYQYVAELKGQTREWSIKVHQGLIQTAKDAGLDYRFDIAKITNSFDAHRVIQYAKSQGLGEEIEERFFKAYFTEGALMSDKETLIKLTSEIGLERDEVTIVLNDDLFAEEVLKDGEEAKQLGATGVPFFVFDRKSAISGAQDAEVFLNTLKSSFSEWINENPTSELEISQGAVCRPDGDCD